jgi:hypothetical protein
MSCSGESKRDIVFGEKKDFMAILPVSLLPEKIALHPTRNMHKKPRLHYVYQVHIIRFNGLTAKKDFLCNARKAENCIMRGELHKVHILYFDYFFIKTALLA